MKVPVLSKCLSKIADTPWDGAAWRRVENSEAASWDFVNWSGVHGKLPSASELHLYPSSLVYRIISQYSKDAIVKAYAQDPWLRNIYLNLWEYATGQTVLDSYPWNIALPVADVCNARCTFCDSWLRGEAVLTPDHLARFEEVLPYAQYLGLEGHGEPLANPHIDEILARLQAILDDRCRAYIITNGVFAGSKLRMLLASRVRTFNFSLNATTPRTHHVVMGLGEDALPTIIKTIRTIARLRDEHIPDLQVTISLVLTRDNLDEACGFVELANQVPVDMIYLRTLRPIQGVTEGLNYHLLPPHLHPHSAARFDELRKAIAVSKVRVTAQPDTWEQPVLTPEAQRGYEQRIPAVISRKDAIHSRTIREHYDRQRVQIVGRGTKLGEILDTDAPNPYGRAAPMECRFLYHNLLCHETSFRMIPCCYMTNTPGYESVVLEPDRPFMEYWNAPAFVDLRARLRQGPLFAACRTCPNQGDTLH
jgi:MoaA/NifB/PqqE/SkfB family radical SAM enzyme